MSAAMKYFNLFFPMEQFSEKAARAKPFSEYYA